jgi:hypothetical protein
VFQLLDAHNKFRSSTQTPKLQVILNQVKAIYIKPGLARPDGLTRATLDLGQVSNCQNLSLQLTRSNLSEPLDQLETRCNPSET